MLHPLNVLKLFSFEDYWVSLGFLKLSAHTNNTSAIQIAVNLIFHEHTTPIEVDCHSMHEVYDAHVISISHITIDLQIDDAFTKAPSWQRHRFLVTKLILSNHSASI